MEIAGSSYLSTLAQVTITFAGFTALFMMLRQAIGGKSTHYDLFATRNYLFLSFLIVAGAMLPQALAACQLSHPFIWRVSGLAIGVALLVFVVQFPFRRRAVTGTRLPLSMWPQQIVFGGVVGLLFVNAVGLLDEPSAGPHLIGITLVLFDLFYAILLTLGMVFGMHPLGTQPKSIDECQS